jgi:hypothetical protein
MTRDGEAYVYGIVRAGAARTLPDSGVEGRPVTLVESGRLGALVSDAPDGPVKANRRNLLAHTEVLQQAVESGCVLPMRFGVVMPGRDAVAGELLDAHEEALLAQLDAFEDLVELDLKVLCPEDVLLRSIVAEQPELAELREKLRDRPADATYFDRIRLGELVAGAVAARRERVQAHVLGRLQALAVAAEAGEPAHEHMLANVAFLVARGEVSRFDEAAEGLARELGPDIRCKYTGPLPPFHFVETAAEAGDAAWA